LIPYLVAYARDVIGLVLLAGGLAKLADGPGQFIVVVRGQDLLPGSWASMVGSLVPWLKMTLAVSLLAGLVVAGTAAAATTLFALFVVAIVVNLFRGGHISCGCFGSGFHARLSWWAALRTLTPCGRERRPLPKGGCR
jgi:hypothetical protein